MDSTVVNVQYINGVNGKLLYNERTTINENMNVEKFKRKVADRLQLNEIDGNFTLEHSTEMIGGGLSNTIKSYIIKDSNPPSFNSNNIIVNLHQQFFDTRYKTIQKGGAGLFEALNLLQILQRIVPFSSLRIDPYF